jgi:hypothetical protein
VRTAGQAGQGGQSNNNPNGENENGNRPGRSVVAGQRERRAQGSGSGSGSSSLVTNFTWHRGRVYDRYTAVLLFESCLLSPRPTPTAAAAAGSNSEGRQNENEPQGTIRSITARPDRKQRPVPLNTIELSKACSRHFNLSSDRTMEIAEKLYQKGILSYPRTETDFFKVHSHVHMFICSYVYISIDVSVTRADIAAIPSLSRALFDCLSVSCLYVVCTVLFCLSTFRSFDLSIFNGLVTNQCYFCPRFAHGTGWTGKQPTTPNNARLITFSHFHVFTLSLASLPGHALSNWSSDRMASTY